MRRRRLRRGVQSLKKSGALFSPPHPRYTTTSISPASSAGRARVSTARSLNPRQRYIHSPELRQAVGLIVWVVCPWGGATGAVAVALPVSCGLGFFRYVSHRRSKRNASMADFVWRLQRAIRGLYPQLGGGSVKGSEISGIFRPLPALVRME